MKHSTTKNHFSATPEAVRAERIEIERLIADLGHQRDALLAREERLRIEADAAAGKPLLVRISHLLGLLNYSEKGFHRLRANPAKGFPEPIYGDSDPRWVLADVEAWIERSKGNGRSRMGCGVGSSG